jgi:hypothetical protein
LGTRYFFVDAIAPKAFIWPIFARVVSVIHKVFVGSDATPYR